MSKRMRYIGADLINVLVIRIRINNHRRISSLIITILLIMHEAIPLRSVIITKKITADNVPDGVYTDDAPASRIGCIMKTPRVSGSRLVAIFFTRALSGTLRSKVKSRQYQIMEVRSS